MRIERKVGIIIAGLGSLLLAVSGAVPALAGTGPKAGFAHVTGIRFAGTLNTTSTSFGGWAFGVKAAKSVTAEFKVPALQCTSTTSGIVASASMLTGSTSSSKFSSAGVLLICSGGNRHLTPAVVVNNTQTNGSQGVHTGDLMQATVTASSTAMTATIADLTTGHTFKFKKSGTGGTSFGQLIGDLGIGSPQLPVDNFGKISYSKGAVGGKAIGSVTPRQAVNMQTSANVLQIQTGAIGGTAKNAFTTTFKHS